MKPSSVVGVTRYYWTKAELERRFAGLRNFGELLVGIAQSRQLAALNQMLGDDYHTAGTVSVFPLFFGPSEARTAPGPPSTPAWDSEGPDFNAPGHIAGQGKMLRGEFVGERLNGIGIGGSGAYCPVCGAEATGKTELPPGYSRQMLAERAGTIYSARARP